MIIRLVTIILLLHMLFGNSMAFAQAKASKAVKVVEEKEPKKTEFPTWEHGSLMFDSKTYEWINEAIKSHKQQVPIEILLPTLFPSINQPALDAVEQAKPLLEQNKSIDKKSDAPPVTPTFYLKSILYFEPSNWSLWLNDKKISDKGNSIAPDNVKVIDINREQAVFLWEKPQIDLFYPNWKAIFTSIENGKYTSPEKNIVVDTTADNISFILKPNQTFISKTLEIVEGRMKSAPTGTEAKPGDIKLDKSTETNLGAKTIMDPLKAMQNVNTIKNILEQNVEKLR